MRLAQCNAQIGRPAERIYQEPDQYLICLSTWPHELRITAACARANAQPECLVYMRGLVWMHEYDRGRGSFAADLISSGVIMGHGC